MDPFDELIEGLVVVGALKQDQAERLRHYLSAARRAAEEREIARYIERRRAEREATPWWRRWLL